MYAERFSSLSFREHTAKVWPENRLTSRIIPADLPHSLLAALVSTTNSLLLSMKPKHQREMHTTNVKRSSETRDSSTSLRQYRKPFPSLTTKYPRDSLVTLVIRLFYDTPLQRASPAFYVSIFSSCGPLWRKEISQHRPPPLIEMLIEAGD